MDKKKNFKKALDFAKKMHKGQFRAGHVPVWFHLARVSNLLSHILEESGEGTTEGRFIISTAGLGHDILEDTKTTEEEVEAVFGRRGFKIIKGMTNIWGDKNVRPYVKQVSLAEEAVRLVKLADLYDNHISVVYNLHLLGLKWTLAYFLPVVTPMRLAVTKTKFKKFRKSAAKLIFLVNSSAFLLEKEIERYKGKKQKNG